MAPIEQKLLALLTERSFKRGEFRLASGDLSTYYIDGRMTSISSEGAFLTGQVLFERTRDIAFEAIGGLAVGAVPMTTAAVIAYHLHGQSKEGFWVRSEEKKHGTQKLIEGNLSRGDRVVIVDDVITKGESSLKAIRAVREFGCTVVRVVTLVDRLRGAAELFAAEGIADYQPVFTLRDFGVDG